MGIFQTRSTYSSSFTGNVSVLILVQNENGVGRITEIIAPEGVSTKGYITTETFSIAGDLHPQFKLPFIRRQPENVKSYIVLESSVCRIY